MARVYIGMGSNIDRRRNIRSGIAVLRGYFGPLTVSNIYQNKAMGFCGDDFFNLVVGFDTEADVHTVAMRLRAIEIAHGRRRYAPKFSPRTLDMDLLLYDDLVLKEEGLYIPRDDITRYAFVLRPLAEVAGQRRHPLLGSTFAQLWEAFDQNREQLHPVDLDIAV